ncbi:MAG: SDR family oxidoreductase [Deltaproteobacteria bacterium]|nr:SDR family oxidoreductase [Deltaproteobacteria bacterium]
MTELRLDGKTALVTGGARRVGRAISRELASAGARVIIHHHSSPEAAEQLAEEVGGGARVLTADLRDAEACEHLLAEAGPLDVLVNNAADFGKRPFVDTDDAAWESMLALNLHAPRRLCRGFARARRPGVIVNLLDIAAQHAWAGYSAYCVSKAGLHMLTRVLAIELAPAVRVCGVAPGVAEFPDSMTDAERERVLARIPQGRAGTPEEVADVVRFLCAGPSYLTGLVVPVDGGRAAGLPGPL